MGGIVMEQKDKELLLKDLCARLPCGVKIKLIRWIDEGLYINTTLEPDDIERLLNDEDGDTEIKPYLFPLSSMTEEQYNEFITISNWNCDIGDIRRGRFSSISYIGLDCIYDTIDWFNKNHFDYRGLIEKGLAINATGLNIY